MQAPPIPYENKIINVYSIGFSEKLTHLDGDPFVPMPKISPENSPHVPTVIKKAPSENSLNVFPCGALTLFFSRARALKPERTPQRPGRRMKEIVKAFHLPLALRPQELSQLPSNPSHSHTGEEPLFSLPMLQKPLCHLASRM